jgi:UDP-N-acetylmuramoylalanine--D-glutamate ligase
LIYEFLRKHYGERVMLGGNIGKSAIRELPNLTKDNIAVLELSSFQLDTMGQNQISSPIAVTTNMYKDHQNWHSDMQDYINAKKNIFKYQDEDGILVTNIDNEITKGFKEEANGKVISFSLLDSTADYYMEKDTFTIYENGQLLMTIHDLILDGEHNLYNILGAVATARTQGVNTNEIQEVLASFKGVSGREELVRELNGVKYFNDTTATSVEAMLAMFNRFGPKYRGKIVMVAGGVDKGLEYGAVSQMMKENLKSLILLEGTASEKIAEFADGVDVYKYYDNLETAVKKAQELASSGDIVILCPGGASFNMFANEFDRGDKYVNFVNNLK